MVRAVPGGKDCFAWGDLVPLALLSNRTRSVDCCVHACMCCNLWFTEWRRFGPSLKSVQHLQELCRFHADCSLYRWVSDASLKIYARDSKHIYADWLRKAQLADVASVYLHSLPEYDDDAHHGSGMRCGLGSM